MDTKDKKFYSENSYDTLELYKITNTTTLEFYKITN